MPLTDVQICSAKAQEKVTKLSDGGGLQCWIMPSGGKLWYLAYRTPEKKQRKLALGAYGIGRSSAYAQCKAGRLTLRKVGSRSLILLGEAERWAAC